MTNLPLSQSGKSALETATEATKQAGEILLAHFHRKKEIKEKSKSNLGTEVDILSEKTIAKLLTNE